MQTTSSVIVVRRVSINTPQFKSRVVQTWLHHRAINVQWPPYSPALGLILLPLVSCDLSPVACRLSPCRLSHIIYELQSAKLKM